MKRLLKPIIVLFLLGGLFAVGAGAALSPMLWPSWQVAELPLDHEAAAEAIISGQLDAAFVATAGDAISTSSQGGRWAQLQLDRDWPAGSAPVLSIADAGYTRVWLYAPPDYREHLLWHANTGSAARFSARALAYALPGDLRAGQSVYLRVQPRSGAAPLRVALTDLPTYQAADLRHVRIITLFGTVQFTMIIVGLCLWLALRDRVFAWFVSYASVQLVYVLLASGEFYSLPGAGLIAPSGNRAAWLAASLSASLSIWFILEFCDLRRFTPRLAAILRVLRWPFIAAALVILLPDLVLDQPLSITLNFLILVASVVAIVAVSQACWGGNRASRFFLVAWMPQVAFTVFRVMQILLGMPQPPWLEYGFPFTMAFASIVVTLGLADATLNARRERDVAHRAAERDGLTGVLNRRALGQQLATVMAAARAHARPLSVLFIDLDHFKAINDRHGHLVGDQCLKAVAEAANAWVPGGKIFGRYGGEEFLAVLPNTTHAEAIAAGEQLRHRIEGLRIVSDGTSAPLCVTASIGVASLLPHDDTPEQLIERADHALYGAKAQGRNRVQAHIPLAVAGA